MTARHFVFPWSSAVVVRSSLTFLLHHMDRDMRLRRVPLAERARHADTMAEVQRLIADLDAGGVPSPSDLAEARH